MPEPSNVEFRLAILSGNSALVDAPRSAVAELLRAVADAVESGRDGQRVFDSNGNPVGNWFLDVEYDDEEEAG